ncbi:BspA family leucine-rich repeat surface protein [Enterococcus sp. UD-01]|jgi:surface protein|uniref:BspA family leucine-rich repeat surface protein n=1 Tax=Enterococcus sp. UD-01 TaxID=3373911 RepID=UPI003836912B
MKQNKYFILIIFFIIFLIFSFKTAYAEEIIGTWGDVPWSYDHSTGRLTFTAGGQLADYKSAPWNTDGEGIDPTAITKITFTHQTIAPANSSYLFGTGDSSTGLTNLTAIDGLNLLDTSNVTNMFYMFNFVGVSQLDLSSFDTSKVTDMRAMFANARLLTTLAPTTFDTRSVTSFMGMFYHNYSLEKLDISSFTIASSTETRNMFFENTNLRELTLGTQSLLSTEMILPEIDHSSGEYTGGWIGTSDTNHGVLYSSSDDFMVNYNPVYPGTYIWQKQPTLTVKDSVIKTSDSWSAEDNFVQATDDYGEAVPFSAITVAGAVDTKTANSYEVTYTYGALTKTATIVVEAVPATLTITFQQKDTVLSDYTLKLTGYNLWDEVDLTTIDAITQTIRLLDEQGYDVTRPENSLLYLATVDTTVTYNVIGKLSLLLPTSFAFSPITYTGKSQMIGTALNESLVVKDTLDTSEKEGWGLFVSVSTPMTHKATGTVAPGAVFHYIDADSNQIRLNDQQQAIASAASGGTQIISENWGTSADSEGLKLALDPSVGAGDYSAVLTWTLQAGPEN